MIEPTLSDSQADDDQMVRRHGRHWDNIRPAPEYLRQPTMDILDQRRPFCAQRTAVQYRSLCIPTAICDVAKDVRADGQGPGSITLCWAFSNGAFDYHQYGRIRVRAGMGP